MTNGEDVLDKLDELGRRCRQFYRIGGLRAASMCLLEGRSAYFPLARVNMVHVPYDLSGVVSIMDTRTFTSKATTMRQPGGRPPLLFADRLGDDLVCGDLEPYKTNGIMNDPFGMASGERDAGTASEAPQPLRRSLHEDWPPLRKLEARYIREAITRTGGKLLGAGSATELLGIHYSTLRKKMLELGIPLPRGARKKSA